MLQKIWMNAVDAACDVFCADKSVFHHFADKLSRRQPIVSIIGNVAILRTDEKFVSANTILFTRWVRKHSKLFA